MGVEDQVNSPGFRSCYLRDTEPDRCLSQLVHIILFARAAALSLTRNLIAMCVAYYNFAVFFLKDIILKEHSSWLLYRAQLIHVLVLGFIRVINVACKYIGLL